MVDTSSAPNRLPGSGSLLVTGATGFLGGVLIRRLLANGVPASRLRCLVRDPERARRSGLPAESLVEADLGAADCGDAIRRAARDVAIVVHLAGSLKAYDRAGFDEVNVYGTERLVSAVREAAPAAHFVHVSSLAAAGPSPDGVGTDLPADRCTTVSQYGESKRRGELSVIGSGMPFTVLRPPVVYGPNDGATRLLFQQVLAPVTAGAHVRFQESVPGAKGQCHVTLHGAGHFLQRDAGETFAGAVIGFCAANPLPAA